MNNMNFLPDILWYLCLSGFSFILNINFADFNKITPKYIKYQIKFAQVSYGFWVFSQNHNCIRIG